MDEHLLPPPHEGGLTLVEPDLSVDDSWGVECAWWGLAEGLPASTGSSPAVP